MPSLQHERTSHFDAIYPLLPPTLRVGIDDLFSKTACESDIRKTLDQLLRFSLCGDATEDYPDSRKEWDTQKYKAEKALSSLQGDQRGKKRSLDDVEPGPTDVRSDPKKPKVDINAAGSADEPVFTLHSISVSSPVRKKVDITVCRKEAIRFTQDASGAQEASIPFNSLTRAFLISTPGKSKPHWTVVLLTQSDQTQVIFGIDAVPPSLTTTVHPDNPHRHPKNTESKPILTQFLSYLPPQITVQHPSTTQFRSPTGDPYVDAYLRAKDGHLFFFEDGILFGEKKPCIWIGMDEIMNVRSLSATGRTFSLFVTRKANEAQDEEFPESEDVEFSMIDGKNQEAVALWVKTYRPRFGVQMEPKNNGLQQIDEPEESHEEQEKKNEDGDSEDSDFRSDSESDGGSPTGESSDEGEGEEDVDADAEEGTTSGEGYAADDNNDDSEELTPSRHPLLRAAVMPKLSRAAIDAVVNMVEADLRDASGGAAGQGSEEEDFDELED